MTWANRDQMTDEDVVGLIANRVIELANIYKDSWCENDDRESFRSDLAEVSEFAKKKNVPFDIDMITTITLGIVSDDGNWQSSSMSC